MPSYRRKPFVIGRSKGITLPASMKISNEVSIASGERLVIMDTTGEVPQDRLLQFFLDQVEPAFQRWLNSQKLPTAQPGAFQAMQAGAPMAVSPVKPIEAEGVATPQPNTPLVSCFNCGQLLAWTIAPGATGACPRCRVILRLVVMPETGHTA